MNGSCQCITGYYYNLKGVCEQQLNCPINSYFSPHSYCCICNSGYTLVNNQCLLTPLCPVNSYYLNGNCYCNNQFVLIRANITCAQCNVNEIYNGYECNCKIGYVKNSNGVCTPKYIITCEANMVYDYFYQLCLCKPGFVWNLGKCNPSTTCPVNAVWNGVNCQCN